MSSRVDIIREGFGDVARLILEAQLGSGVLHSGLLKVKLVVKLTLSEGVRLSERHDNPAKLPLSVT